MKIYRVVPDLFLTGKKLNLAKKNSFEHLYYKTGCTSFSDEVSVFDFNTLNTDYLKGKFFYLFFEDAIEEENRFIKGYHRLNADVCAILEYDVPLDIIMKHIGYGDYSIGIRSIHLLETFVESSDIGSKEVMITDEEKINNIVETFAETLQMLPEYGAFIISDLEYYTNLFGYKLSQYKDLSSVSLERIKEILLSSNIYSLFLNQRSELLSSPYITGKTVPLNDQYIFSKFRTQEEISTYWQSFGITYETSKESLDFKEELLYQVSRVERDMTKIKKLLIEKF